MVFTITTDLVEINDCDAITDWSASGGAGLTADTDFKKEGIASLSIKVSNSTKFMEYDPDGSWDLTNTFLYWWMNVSTYSKLDTIANGGCIIRLTDTLGNYSEWHFAGSDTYNGGWKRFILDVTKTPTTTSGTLDLALVDTIRFIFTTTSAANLNNCYIDIIHYLNSGNYAIKGIQGTIGDKGDWQDILDADAIGGYGIVQETDSIIFLLGPIQFGDLTNANDTYFKDGKILVFCDPQYYYTSLISMLSDGFYKLNFVGESTKVTDIQFGEGSDVFGYSGGIIMTVGPDFDWDSETDSADIDSIKMYGVTFMGAGTIKMDEGVGKTQKFITCIFDDCDEVQPNTAQVWHCTVMNSVDVTGAMEMLSGHNIKDVDFYNNSRGIHYPNTGTYTLDACQFSGNTYDIKNTSGGLVTVNCTNGSNPTNSEDDGGTTDIQNAVTLKVIVKDEGGTPIENVQVAIYRQSNMEELMNEDTLATGIAEQSFNYTGDVDVYLRIRKSSTGTRYKPISTIGTITADGFTYYAVLIEDKIA